ncbi:MAG: M67 family metallopeptidase [Anaerolineaceae bacterium]|nr:M67 family metallopeptidase [Anaerolineaceae bacterium]
MLEIRSDLINQIEAVGEEAYPEEGAGFLLGKEGKLRSVQAIFFLPNAREEGARKSRYLISPEDLLRVEEDAEACGLDIIGVFHSHPDQPNWPSPFDLSWALPWFSYVITTINLGHAQESRAWRLVEDRSLFEEEPIQIQILKEKTE